MFLFFLMFTERLKVTYKYSQILSIDIALGACAGMLFFDKLVNAELRLLLYLLLALAVWCIYTFDHLLDARQIKSKASAPRHAYHQKHFKPLCAILVTMGSLGLITALYLLQVKFIIFSGVALGTLILLIFIFLKISPSKWIYLKEISISTLYVGGIMLAPYFHNDYIKVPKGFWLLGFAYVLVAWFNTLYLGVMDRESDKEDGLHSSALAVGEERSMKFLFVLMGFMLLYPVSLYLFLPSRFYLHISIVLVMALIHSVVFLKSKKGTDNTRGELDAAFLFPFILLLIS